MLEEKIARSVSAAFSVLMLAFIPLYIFFDFAFASESLFFGLGCTAIGVVVAQLMGRRHAALQMLAAAAPAAALAFAVPIGIEGAAIARYAMLGAGILLAVWAERLALRPAEAGKKVGPFIVPMAVTLFACGTLWLYMRTAGKASPGLWQLMAALGSLWLLVSLYMMNRLSLRQAAFAASQSGIPAGARRSGALGVTIFAVAVFLLASIGAIVRAIADALKWLIEWCIKAYVYLAGLLFPGGSQAQPTPTGSPDQMLPPAQGAASPFMKLLSDILLYAAVIAVAALIVYGLYKLLPKLWKWLLGRVGGLISTWREDEGYVDRSESLMNLRQALSDAGTGLRKFVRRFRRRPRIGDYPTNAGKVRFLFREYLHGLVSVRQEPSPGATATEIARSAPALSSAYNLARYAGEEPTDAQIEKACEAVRQK